MAEAPRRNAANDTEDRGQRTEDRGQRSEVRGQRSGVDFADLLHPTSDIRHLTSDILSFALLFPSSFLPASEGERSAEERGGASVLRGTRTCFCGHVETPELARRLFVPCDRDARLSALHCGTSRPASR